MNISLRTLRCLGVFGLGAVLHAAATASPITITTLNSPTAFSISHDAGGGLLLSATGTLTVTSGFNSSLLTLHVVLNNASALNGTALTPAANVRLTSWGFGVDPNATGVTFSDPADGGLIDASLGNIPNLAAIEVCAWGGNNCSGGGNGGIQAGTTDVFDLLLAGAWGSSVVIDPLGVKIQTGLGSFEFDCTGTCTSGDIPGPTPTAVPEPQSLALLGMGLIALAAVARRRRTFAA